MAESARRARKLGERPSIERTKIKRVERRSSTQRGYDRRWRRARLAWLRLNPICVICAKSDRYITATVVDHIQPHRGDQVLFWDTANWQSLCKPCHDKKTASET